jgi:hypothetical protein
LGRIVYWEVGSIVGELFTTSLLVAAAFKGLARYLLSGCRLRVTPTRVFGGTSGASIFSIESKQLPGGRPTNLNLICQEQKFFVPFKPVPDPSAMPSDIRSFFGGGGPKPAEATAKTTTVNLTFCSYTASHPLFAKLLRRAGSYAWPHQSAPCRFHGAINQQKLPLPVNSIFKLFLTRTISRLLFLIF